MAYNSTKNKNMLQQHIKPTLSVIVAMYLMHSISEGNWLTSFTKYWTTFTWPCKKYKKKIHKRIPWNFAHMLKNLRIKGIVILPGSLLNLKLWKQEHCWVYKQISTTCSGIQGAISHCNMLFSIESRKAFVEDIS